MKPGKHQRANKDGKIYYDVARSTTVHSAQYMSYVTNTCTVKAKNENKNIQQRTWSSFITFAFN